MNKFHRLQHSAYHLACAFVLGCVFGVIGALTGVYA